MALVILMIHNIDNGRSDYEKEGAEGEILK